MNFFGTQIFWTVLGTVVVVMSLATVLGRMWAELFPYRLRAVAYFYLAPALGLATLVIFASLISRILPFRHSFVVPLFVAGLTGAILARKPDGMLTLRQSLWVSLFGLACGASILSPLFVFGAFNAHNDAFCYLVHGGWLQAHSFGEVIPPQMVTPLTSQVFWYQQGSFRMGASCLLAFLQSTLHLRWSYEVYPAVVISAIAVGCLSIGFPLAGALRPIPRWTRLMLLAFPAFTLGGFVFGSNFGFFPQTVGLALGGGFLFVLGPLFRWISNTDAKWRVAIKAILPCSILLAGAIFAYHELSPFLLTVILVNGVFLAFRFRTWGKVFSYTGVLLGGALLLLNTELVRVFNSMPIQCRGVIVAPIDWTLLGYMAHALGVHGGAPGDGFQWTSAEFAGSMIFAAGFLLLMITSTVIFLGRQAIRRMISNGALMPAMVILILFGAGLFFFRYFVPPIFPKEAGETWSQFKLSEWAHPFVMAFVLLSLAALRPRFKKTFNRIIATLFLIGLVNAELIGFCHVRPLMRYYNPERNLHRFYRSFRDTVLAACPREAPVYLALEGQHHKFKEMATLYLDDRKVTSDWRNSVYISLLLPAKSQTQELKVGDCVVEPKGQDGWLSQGTPIGPYQVGVFDGQQKRIRIASVTGAYDRETDGRNWWRWVEHKVIFQLQPLFVPNESSKAILRFEYGSRGKQTLTVRVRTREGSSQQFILRSEGETPVLFEKTIDLLPSELSEISIETDGKATPLGRPATLLGGNDDRMAAWIIRNISIRPA